MRSTRYWAKAPGQTTSSITTSNADDLAENVRASCEYEADSSASYSQLARTFSAKSSAFDVVMLDVVWPGAFAQYLVDLKPALAREARAHSAGIIRNNTINGKLVAMPWFGDFGILYYRTDLLRKYGYSKPPTTWAQLGAMAQKIQDGEQASNPNFYGFVYQGNAYEGLTCDALEWFASSGAGNFVDNGKASLNNPRAVAIMNLQRSFVGNITPRGVTTYQEGEADQAFGAGNAAFMRNWPYAYSKSQTGPVKGKFDVTVLPRTGSNPSVGTVGGWQLGVSSFSKNREAAIELVRYLTSAPVEKFNAIYNSNVPTIPAVARDGRAEGQPLAQARDRERRPRDPPDDPGHEVRAGLPDHLPGPEPDPQRPGRQERPARYRAAAEPPAPIAAHYRTRVGA